MEREYEIWMEGFAATGASGIASKIGSYKAFTFDEAVENMLKEHPEHKQYYRISETSGKHLIWGCRLFDNAGDARKSFG